MGIFSDDRKIKKEVDTKTVDEGKLKLKKEELDVEKRRRKIGDVEVGKEIVTEEVTREVPITHEEVLIEKRSLSKEPTDAPIETDEKIHIPIMDEFVEVGKHTVASEEVSAQKREVEDVKHVKESLKKEKAYMHKDGDPNIVKNELDDDRRKDFH